VEAASERPRLVLDAGGVLFAEEFRPFLTALATAAGHDPEELMDLYNGQLRFGLWRGELTEDEFWAAIAAQLGITPDAPSWRAAVTNALAVLPAQAELARWAEVSELWILSNQRHEWLYPMLEEAEIKHLFERILVSSEIGMMKPDPQTFAPLLEGAPERVLFVDDKQENLDAAAAQGIETLLADPEHQWFAAVDRWLAAG
jgi:HAD superfamily hydrolase (TIGR01509 family)